MNSGLQRIILGLIENYQSFKFVIRACIFPGDEKNSGSIF